MSKNTQWTERRTKVASLLVSGKSRKEIGGDLGVSLTTVGREIDALMAITGAANAQKLIPILQSTYADKLRQAHPDSDPTVLAPIVVKRNMSTVFTALMFALVVTGYGMHLLITAHEVWNLQGINKELVYTLSPITIIALGVAMMVFGGRTERECGVVWLGYMVLDNLVLDRLLGHAPGAQEAAWSTAYPEWVLANLYFLIGYSLVYVRHRQHYVGWLVFAQVFSLVVHAIQGLTGIFAPFPYAATIIIPYYFQWVFMSTGLCMEFHRSPPRWLTNLISVGSWPWPSRRAQ